MDVLVVVATFLEAEPLLERLGINSSGGEGKNIFFGKQGGNTIHLVVTGIGMMQTAYAISKVVGKYDLAINAGVCGSFNAEIGIGDVVSVKRDRFSELGAQDHMTFLPIDQLGLPEYAYVDTLNLESTYPSKLKEVNGITVNTVHGNDQSIRQVKERFNPDVETMEGAAFLYACSQENVASLQVRGVSNMVEQRNKENWDVKTAVQNMTDEVYRVIEKLNND